MESKTFKKLLAEVLQKNNFKKDGNYFRKYDDEIICVVGIQKSKFSNAYYLNIGYIIKELRPELIKPKDIDGHIRARFSCCLTDNQSNLFDLENIQASEDKNLIMCFNQNINEYFNGYLSINGIKNLLERNPIMLYQTTLATKTFLGLHH